MKTMVGLAVGLADASDPPVVAYLPPHLLSPLRVAVRGFATLHVATSLEELDMLLTLHPSATLVADPQGAPGLREPKQLIPILERHPAIRGVTYTAVSKAGMHGYGMLASRGFYHLLIRSVDDSPERIRDLVATVPADRLGERLVRKAEPLFCRLPVSLRRALTELFLWPKDLDSAQRIAMSGGVSRRHLDHVLEKAGIAQPQVLIRAARMVRFYHYTSGRGENAKDVAPRLGYQTIATLSNDVKKATGFPVRHLIRHVNEDDFLEILFKQLHRRGPSRQKVQAAKLAKPKPPVATVAPLADVPLADVACADTPPMQRSELSPAIPTGAGPRGVESSSPSAA